MDSATTFPSLSNQFYPISEIYYKTVLRLEYAVNSTITLLYEDSWLPINIVTLIHQKNRSYKGIPPLQKKQLHRKVHLSRGKIQRHGRKR